MADKPRVKAPKQRAGSTNESDSRRRALVIGAAIAGVVLGFAAVAAAMGLVGGGSGADEESVREQLVAAGCTLKTVPAVEGNHSLPPDGSSDEWNTDPPTSGPHFGFNADGSVGTVIWGAYEEPIQVARLIHNLEHGGIYILYGDDVPEDTVAQLRAFYDDHQNGTVLAPYPKLGNQVALGAWVAEGEDGNGHLAKCTAFDESSFETFFRAFQFQGPERFPSEGLLPGHT
jgi:hypothetical protein